MSHEATTSLDIKVQKRNGQIVAYNEMRIKKAISNAFKEQFTKAAVGRFGSGCAWLVVQNGKLVIGSTPNQDNPLMDVCELKGTPILGVDVWEHAYYLLYQNRRPDYVAAFYNAIDWDAVESNYNSSLKS